MTHDERQARSGWPGCLPNARRRVAFLTVFWLALPTPAFAVDTDGDLVDDLVDNCLLEPNGPNELSNQIDTDLDGYGNACDPDHTNDGLVTTVDTGVQLNATLTDAPLIGTDLVYDLDGDGHGTLNDLMIKFFYQVNFGVPGP